MTELALKNPETDTQETVRGAVKWPSWSLQPPPEGSPEVASWVWHRFEYMKKYRETLGLPALWLRFHELYRNRLFKKRSPYTQISVNLVFKVINTMQNNLTDNKPRASIMARGDTSEESANGWQSAYDTWWEQTKQQDSLQESVGKSELYGFQVDKMIWNPDAEGGLGEVETVRCDPFGIFLWPRTMDVQKGPIAHAEALQLGEIFQRWPKSEELVKADPAYSDLLGESRADVRASKGRRDLRPIGGGGDFYQTGEVDAPRSRYGEDVGGRALVVEFWCEDYTVEYADPRTGEKVNKNKELWEPAIDPETGAPLVDEVSGQPYMQQVMDPETGEPLKPTEQAKYPGFIRCITVVNSGVKSQPMVLEDRPNPSINPTLPREITSHCYFFHKKPFIKRLSYSDDVSEYGLSIVEQIEGLVMEICRKMSQIGMHLHNQAIAPLIMPKDCGVDQNQVSNLPKRVWRPTTSMLGQGIRFLQVPPMSSDYIVFIETLIRLVDMITGITDVSEGRRPTGVTAGIAISELQEKAQVAFRRKIRNLDTSIEEQMRMYQSLGQNWMSDERKLLIGEGQDQKTITFQGMSEEYQGEYAYHVEAGSTLPRSRTTQRQEIVKLGEIGMADDVAVLKELKVADWKGIIRRKQQGIIGMALEKLGQSGMIDEATLQTAQQILALDDNQFKKAFPDTGNPFENIQ